MSATEVLIAGAGPTGLTLAIEMKRFGIPFRLIDKSEESAQWSQALVVQSRTLEQFERYGLADLAMQRGRKLTRASLISEGKTVFTFSLDHIPGRYPFVLFLPQSETERILIEHLSEQQVEVERGVELKSVQNNESGVEVLLRHKDGAEENTSARWLVGCDGAHSAVRESQHIPFEGQEVSLSFFLGDLELSGPDLLRDELRVYLHKGDVIFIGQLSENTYRVIVALHENQSSQQQDKKLELADFQQAFNDAGIQLKVVSSSWMTPFHVNDRQAAQYRAKGVFLAGDASHIHSPVGGQGMNTGIQDAANLAWKLAAVANGAPDSLLDSYGEERAEVGKALLRGTSRVLSAATNPNPIFEKVRDAVMSAGARLNLVQERAVGFVSETAIEYRNSSVVMDCGGDGELRAGDRVPNPDVEFTDERWKRLLDPLREAKSYAIAMGIKDVPGLKNRLPRATVVTLGNKDNGSDGVLTGELERLFGKGNRILVVRPDGYLGFRGSESDASRLDEYSQLMGLV